MRVFSILMLRKECVLLGIFLEKGGRGFVWNISDCVGVERRGNFREGVSFSGGRGRVFREDILIW